MEEFFLKQINCLKRNIYNDCRQAMAPAVICYALNDILGAIIGVYTAVVLGKFADAVFNLDISYGIANFWTLILCLSITVFLIPIFRTLGEILMFSDSLKHDMMIIRRFFSKNCESVMKFDEGETQYRIEEDPNDFRISWVNQIVKASSIPFALIFLLYNAIRISWMYTIFVFALSAIKVFVPLYFKNRQAIYERQTAEYDMRVRIYETELASKPYNIKLFGLSDFFIDRLQRCYKNYFKNILSKKIASSTISDSISHIIDTFSMLGIILIGAIMVSNNKISAGAIAEMVGFFWIINIIMSNIDFIIRNAPILDNLTDRLKSIYDDIEENNGESIDSLKSISVSNLSFSYGENSVLNKVSFSIEAGDKTVILGENGSGKTTLIKILCGLLSDYDGDIMINNHELKTISPNSWRNQFAYVSQDPYIFHGCIKENIHIVNPRATENEVSTVMKELAIHHLSDRVVSFNQNDLSGGEKQKISLARALLKNTQVLFFDEPANNLDKESAIWLSNFISKSSKTIIFVSHDDMIIDPMYKRICL